MPVSIIGVKKNNTKSRRLGRYKKEKREFTNLLSVDGKTKEKWRNVTEMRLPAM
jgi:hypothetical protein